MTTIPRVTGKKVLSALKRAGFQLFHFRGSHHYLKSPINRNIVTIAVHAEKTLKPKTLKSIIKQAGLTVEEFIRILK